MDVETTAITPLSRSTVYALAAAAIGQTVQDKPFGDMERVRRVSLGIWELQKGDLPTDVRARIASRLRDWVGIELR